MMKPTLSTLSLALALGAIAPRAHAEPTRELMLRGPTEILEGDPETASVDARGQLTMGPQLVELGRVTDRPIVSMVAGPKGVLHAGTAGGGVLELGATGAAKVVTPADGLVVSALAWVKGTLHVATSPDGKIVSLGADGKVKTVFDPTAKYVWAMIEDGNDLVVATGEPGTVVRVTPNGPAPSLFEPGETHVRALVRHPKRGLVAGGGQKGIVYQLDAKGGAFALYDSEMEEVTALAVDDATGDLYAALVSETKPGSFDPDKTIGAVAGDTADDTSPIKGSEVVRITERGHVETVWGSKREGALALAFDAKTKRLLVATGTHAKGRGRIYAIDTADRDRVLLVGRIEAPLASTLVQTGAGVVVGTSPSGQVLRLGPGVRSQSTWLSKEQDLARGSTIGRLWFDADVPQGAKVDVAIRSGNTKEHDKTWSDWSADVSVADGAEVKVREGRYVQLRVRLSAAPNGKPPVVKSVHASVARVNLPPTVNEVFALRRGVYLSKIPPEEEREKTVTLSRSVIAGLRQGDDDDDRGTVRVRQGTRPGMATIAWRADDPNGDGLIYKLEVQDPKSADGAWTTLADAIEDEFHTFDSRAWRDGRYVFRLTASDRPSNGPSEALVDRSVSEPVTIDNTAPVVRAVSATSPAPGRVRVEVDAEDETSPLAIAEVSVDGGPWLMLPAADGLVDAKKERLVVELAPSDGPGGKPVPAGRRSVLVRIEDDAGNASTASTVVVVR